MQVVILEVFLLVAMLKWVKDAESACRNYQKKLILGKPASLDCYHQEVRIPYGKTHLFIDQCLECTCQLSSPLQCCNIDHGSHLVEVKGCKAVQRHCQTVLVDASDESKPCPYTQEQSTSMVATHPPASSVTRDYYTTPERGYRFGGNGALSLTAEEYMFLLEIAVGILMQKIN